MTTCEIEKWFLSPMTVSYQTGSLRLFSTLEILFPLIFFRYFLIKYFLPFVPLNISSLRRCYKVGLAFVLLSFYLLKGSRPLNLWSSTRSKPTTALISKFFMPVKYIFFLSQLISCIKSHWLFDGFFYRKINSNITTLKVTQTHKPQKWKLFCIDG